MFRYLRACMCAPRDALLLALGAGWVGKKQDACLQVAACCAALHVVPRHCASQARQFTKAKTASSHNP